MVSRRSGHTFEAEAVDGAAGAERDDDYSYAEGIR